MLASIVTDDQLFTSQIVKSIILVITAGGAIFNLYRVFRKVSIWERVVNLILFIALAVIFFFVIKIFLIEAALLKRPVYATGTTIGYCNVFAEGEGIEFEYTVHGVNYHNCSTFHPLPKDKIKVPGGKYMVRTTSDYPDQGRMNFNSIPGKK
jgi:hypothetical protein